MGELFRRGRPETALDWTGERLVTSINGSEIEGEHLHRYFLAREFCRGKQVLDVASGEGYGSALLAQTANHVTGVERDERSVRHARQNYLSGNLAYLQGEATHLPLDTESVDAVVSFETLEHFFDQEAFIQEVKRVLRPNGFLIISTPDNDVYPGLEAVPNPFHVRELSATAFVELLQSAFANISVLRQKIIQGSAIFPDNAHAGPSRSSVFEQRDLDTFEGDRSLPRAPYLIAIATNADLPPIGASVYAQIPTELKMLRETVAAYIEQDPNVRRELESAAQVKEEAATLRIEAAQAKERLANSEQELLRSSQLILSLESELNQSRDLLKRAAVASQDAERAAAAAQDAETTAKKDLQLLKEALHNATAESSIKQQQLDAASRLSRQQTISILRLQRQCRDALSAYSRHESIGTSADLSYGPSELARTKEALAQQEQLVKELSSLIVPVWARKMLPSRLRPLARAIKRGGSK